MFNIDATHKLQNVSIHDAESFRDDLSPWGCICCEDGEYTVYGALGDQCYETSL